ncbi:protein of unknown function [Burkholderia multivorans]
MRHRLDVDVISNLSQDLVQHYRTHSHLRFLIDVNGRPPKCGIFTEIAASASQTFAKAVLRGTPSDTLFHKGISSKYLADSYSIYGCKRACPDEKPFSLY